MKSFHIFHTWTDWGKPRFVTTEIQYLFGLTREKYRQTEMIQDRVCKVCGIHKVRRTERNEVIE